jgi:hypothetical protein
MAIKITRYDWDRIEAHFGGRACELTASGQIVFANADYPVGYIADDLEVYGYFVDVTGDADKLIFRTGTEA